jgi:hypothetical protein
MLDFNIATVVYCALIGVFFLGIWLFFDRRDHRRFEQERRKAAFHCIRCDRLYVGTAGAEMSKCPRCGHENMRLRF